MIGTVPIFFCIASLKNSTLSGIPGPASWYRTLALSWAGQADGEAEGKILGVKLAQAVGFDFASADIVLSL